MHGQNHIKPILIVNPVTKVVTNNDGATADP